MKTFFEETLERVGLSMSEFEEKVTILGFKGVAIEGHKGLIEYQENKICIKFHKKNIKIVGEKLLLKEITKDELLVYGNISGVMIDNGE